MPGQTPQCKACKVTTQGPGATRRTGQRQGPAPRNRKGPKEEASRGQTQPPRPTGQTREDTGDGLRTHARVLLGLTDDLAEHGCDRGLEPKPREKRSREAADEALAAPVGSGRPKSLRTSYLKDPWLRGRPAAGGPGCSCPG